MKLLLDENVPIRLLADLALFFPGSAHVVELGFESASDETLWNFARDNHFAIMSKDSDFHHRVLAFGAPPKLIYLRCGNTSTALLRDLLLTQVGRITKFLADEGASVLVVSQ